MLPANLMSLTRALVNRIKMIRSKCIKAYPCNLNSQTEGLFTRFVWPHSHFQDEAKINTDKSAFHLHF